MWPEILMFLIWQMNKWVGLMDPGGRKKAKWYICDYTIELSLGSNLNSANLLESWFKYVSKFVNERPYGSISST